MFFPDQMIVDASERNVTKLNANYVLGQAQLEREWRDWMEFISA